MTDIPSVTAALLREGRTMRVVPRGQSMFPTLNGVDDSVVVAPLQGVPKKNDLALYLDCQDQLVVHRVVAVDTANATCDMLGDGNITVERGVPWARVYGRVIRICRHGHEFSVGHPVYRCCVFAWRLLYRKRQPVLRRLQRLRDIRKGKGSI